MGLYHNKKENSPSGGSRMTHASHSGPMENQAQRLHATQLACNQYRNRLSCILSTFDARSRPLHVREWDISQREGELTLRGLSDDTCVHSGPTAIWVRWPFGSDGDSSSTSSRNVTRVQSIPKSLIVTRRVQRNNAQNMYCMF